MNNMLLLADDTKLNKWLNTFDPNCVFFFLSLVTTLDTIHILVLRIFIITICLHILCERFACRMLKKACPHSIQIPDTLFSRVYVIQVVA